MNKYLVDYVVKNATNPPYYIFIIILGLWLTGCEGGEHYAPVLDISQMQEMPRSGVHRVAQGETLYSIAWRYGLDYRYLALRNRIPLPYTIFIGQAISLRGPARKPQRESLPGPAIAREEAREPHYSSSGWRWPTPGKIIQYYSVANKGINIAGKLGQPIYATAAGKVVYSGNGLRGYGNLIIIKHSSLMLSAYAHNSQVLVKEGNWVGKGQKIAEMGNNGSDKAMLHFEIRRAGKPVNPLSLYRGQALLE